MRILMVGGSGYVGGMLLPGLAEVHEVRILDPNPPAADCDGVDYLAGSACDPTDLAAALTGMDAVIHAAMGGSGADGWPDPASAFDINLKSVYLTLQAAHRRGVPHGVHISSLSVFADSPELRIQDRGLDETSPADATDAYGLSKRLAETVCRAAVDEWGMTVTSLRLGWPTPDHLWPVWAAPKNPEPMVIRRADGTQIPALAASDLTRAVLAALEFRAGFDVFHITGDDGTGRFWNLTKARELLGWQPLRR
jgi:nucleoside-diphosphate-sugar epimerase